MIDLDDDFEELRNHPAVRAYHKKLASRAGKVMTEKKMASLKMGRKGAGAPKGNKNYLGRLKKVNDEQA